MTIRNLGLYFTDDRPLPGAIPPFIEMRSPNPFGWSAHCRDAFQDRELQFDLITSDINFSLDRTDPAPQNRPSDSFGLVHFLAVMARRQDVDLHRNRLPLAWEVRTVSPGAYLNDDHAIRVYGLIRAMAARRVGRETLQQCLWREGGASSISRSDDAALTEQEWSDLSFRDVMALDLSNQAQVTSDPADAIARLLPKWRSQLLCDIKEGYCRVDADAICKQHDILSKLDVIRATVDGTPEYEIPMADETRKRQYGLNLLSVFADHVQADGEAYILDCRVEEVSEYLIRLVEVVRSNGSSRLVGQTMAYISGRAYSMLDDPEKLQSCITGREWPSEHKAMLFCFLVALSAIRSSQAVVLSRFVKNFGIAANQHTWIRALDANRTLFPGVGPKRLATMIQGAMRGDAAKIEELGASWDWLKAGLSEWLRTKASGTDRAAALINTPDLVQMGAPHV